MTEPQKQELMGDLRRLRDRLETQPRDGASDLEIASHYYGLCVTALPVLDAALITLST